MFSKRYLAKPSFLVFAVLLSACTVGPDFAQPEAPTVKGYTEDKTLVASGDQQIIAGDKLSEKWWQAYQSSELDDVMQKALKGNQTLAAATANLSEAQEQVRATGGALWPQLSLGGDAGRQKYGASLFGPSNITIPPFTYYTVGPQVSYLLDFAGVTRRGLERDQAFAEFQGYETDAARLSLTGNVMAQALAIASAKAQIEAINQIINDDQRNVDLVQKERDAGAATMTDVLISQSQLAADQTLMPPLDQQLSVARHALSILVGEAPADWQPPEFTLAALHLPKNLPLRLPSELVHERPDIMAAEAQLHAATATVGVTTANLYPNITLSADITQQALTPHQLFFGSSNAWSILAQLTAPIFTGGTLEAEKRGAEDALKASIANYQQTVLQSFGQVADVLKALEHDDQHIKAQQHALDTAKASLNLSRLSYKEGNTGVLQVLDAERLFNEAELAMVRVKAQQYQDTALLFLSLGGGSLSPIRPIDLSPL